MFAALKERRKALQEADKRKEKARVSSRANSGGGWSPGGGVTYVASDSYDDSSYSSSSCSGSSSSYDSGSSDSGSYCD